MKNTFTINSYTDMMHLYEAVEDAYQFLKTHHQNSNDDESDAYFNQFAKERQHIMDTVVNNLGITIDDCVKVLFTPHYKLFSEKMAPAFNFLEELHETQSMYKEETRELVESTSKEFMFEFWLNHAVLGSLPLQSPIEVNLPELDELEIYFQQLKLSSLNFFIQAYDYN
ncbi:MAG: hypothetical protein GT601_18215 [Acidaminobacter sp.]|uniref:hypothetical protein n=1 Tax=Acidaminobacter sp. TaxID=1872102 RepID=UPI00137F41FB|nr:hypothetical protein [Acidaminobacter sp.]MZQ99607.1 hypothetical protein [Acidaminobacter sp.]